jgi:hypothetical protein
MLTPPSAAAVIRELVGRGASLEVRNAAGQRAADLVRYPALLRELRSARLLFLYRLRFALYRVLGAVAPPVDAAGDAAAAAAAEGTAAGGPRAPVADMPKELVDIIVDFLDDAPE